MADITWTTETRKLGDLVPWEQNPRQIKEQQAKRLAESFDTFGQVETIAIGPGNELHNGHQRLNVLMAQHGPAYEITVRVASRTLTEHERQKLTAMLHAGAVGAWDWDLLAGWDAAELMGWGFDDDLLQSWNSDAANLALMLEAEAAEKEIGEEFMQIRPREMARVLVSVPVDLAADVRLILAQLEDIDGIEILYGAN